MTILLDIKPGQALVRAQAMSRFEEIADPRVKREKALAKADANIARCEKAIEMLMPIERDAKTVLREKLVELRKLRREIAYPKLSFEPFTWRNEEGFPVFALFDLQGGEFQISENGWNSTLPEVLRKTYDDVSSRLGGLHHSVVPLWMKFLGLMICGPVVFYGAGLSWLLHIDSSTDCPIPWYIHPIALLLGILGAVYLDKVTSTELVIRASYRGVMPDRIRRRLPHLETEFKSLYILAEIPKWKVMEVAMPLTDPLLLGFEDNAFYVLDVYDTTPIEEYVRREFAV